MNLKKTIREHRRGAVTAPLQNTPIPQRFDRKSTGDTRADFGGPVFPPLTLLGRMLQSQHFRQINAAAASQLFFAPMINRHAAAPSSPIMTRRDSLGSNVVLLWPEDQHDDVLIEHSVPEPGTLNSLGS
jgi:hypothetical protein